MKKILVAKSGVNALTATSPNDYIFHSDYNTFKILEAGTLSPTLAHGGTVEQQYGYEHGLAINPFVFAFCKFTNGRASPPGCKASNADFWFTGVSSDGGFIGFFYVNNTGGNYTPTFSYILCEVPIT